MPAEVKVFVAGSRALTRLNEALRQRLDRIMAGHFAILIGDANGADKAVQVYLAAKRYEKVTVYCTGPRCRNNIGPWPIKTVAPPPGVRSGFEYYAAKDRAMAADASHGLMIWDGESRGTFTSVVNLVAESKPVVLYLEPARSFRHLHTTADLLDVLDEATTDVRRHLEPLIERLAPRRVPSPGIPAPLF
jgi:hypothetical protein